MSGQGTLEDLGPVGYMDYSGLEVDSRGRMRVSRIDLGDAVRVPSARKSLGVRVDEGGRAVVFVDEANLDHRWRPQGTGFNRSGSEYVSVSRLVLAGQGRRVFPEVLRRRLVSDLVAGDVAFVHPSSVGWDGERLVILLRAPALLRKMEAFSVRLSVEGGGVHVDLTGLGYGAELGGLVGSEFPWWYRPAASFSYGSGRVRWSGEFTADDSRVLRALLGLPPLDVGQGASESSSIAGGGDDE